MACTHRSTRCSSARTSPPEALARCPSRRMPADRQSRLRGIPMGGDRCSRCPTEGCPNQEKPHVRARRRQSTRQRRRAAGRGGGRRAAVQAAGAGSVLGYLAAGLAIGPFGIGFFSDPKSILHVAELGVVMFLFIIGLEMQPSRLWKLRERSSAWAWPRCGLRRAADRGRPAGRAVGAGRVHGGHGLRAVLHRHRHADPGRARRDRQRPGPAHRFHPAAGRLGHRAATGIGRAAGARRHGRARRSLDPGRHRAELRAGAAGGWSMAAQSAVPPAGRARARS